MKVFIWLFSIFFFTVSASSDDLVSVQTAPDSASRPTSDDSVCRDNCGAVGLVSLKLECSKPGTMGQPGPEATCSLFEAQQTAVVSCMSACMNKQSQKKDCEANGGVFIDEWWGVLEGGDSYCKHQQCPEGTTMEKQGPAKAYFSCKCNSDSKLPNLLVASDATPEKVKGVCNGEDIQVQRNDCIGGGGRESFEGDSCELENANVIAAEAQASNKAEVDLKNKLDVAEKNTKRVCQEAFGFYTDQYSKICSARSSTSSAKKFSGAGTEEHCKYLKAETERILETDTSQFDQCLNAYTHFFGNCSSTVTRIGTGSAKVGSGDSEVSRYVEKSGTRSIEENINIASVAASMNNRMAANSGTVKVELSKVQANVDKCIASFKEDEPGSTESSLLSTLDEELSRGLARKFGKKKRKGSSPKGELGGSANFSSNLGGQTSNDFFNQTDDGASYDLSGDPGLDGVPDIASFQKASNLNRGKTSNRTTAASPSGSPKNTRASLPGGDSSEDGKKNKEKKRGYKTAKVRNLANGYKTVKTSDGGRGVTIKPFDFKKFGSIKIKKSLADARKLHGKKLPLIFRNGKFILDFLAMKESKRFKGRNQEMENRFKGRYETGRVLSLSGGVQESTTINIFHAISDRYKLEMPQEASRSVFKRRKYRRK